MSVMKENSSHSTSEHSSKVHNTPLEYIESLKDISNLNCSPNKTSAFEHITKELTGLLSSRAKNYTKSKSWKEMTTQEKSELTDILKNIFTEKYDYKIISFKNLEDEEFVLKAQPFEAVLI